MERAPRNGKKTMVTEEEALEDPNPEDIVEDSLAGDELPLAFGSGQGEEDHDEDDENEGDEEEEEGHDGEEEVPKDPSCRNKEALAPRRPSAKAIAKAQRERRPETLPIPITIVDPAPNTLYGVVIASISKCPVPADSSKRPAGTIALEAGLSKIFEFGVKSKVALGLLQIVAIFIN
ncbi:hypothetical protein HDU96_004877, partial [Phlyctochytrium bullatum]